MKTSFIRLTDVPDKADVLRRVAAADNAFAWRLIRLDPTRFRTVPGSPFAYWVSDQMLEVYLALAPFDGNGRTVRQGLATSDNFRFIRLAVEVLPASASDGLWRVFAKGGSSAQFYSDLSLTVLWGTGQPELEAYGEIKGNGPRARQSSSFYFRPGVTWPLRAARFAASAFPAGSIFSVRGACAFVLEADLGWALAVFNSSIFDYIFKISLGRHGFPEFIVGVLQQLPWAIPTVPADKSALAALARRAWSLKRSLDTRNETSHAFVLPALLQVSGKTLAIRAADWAGRVRAAEDELAAIQAEIDQRCFALYGISEEDRRSITEGFGGSTAGSEDASGGADSEEEVEAEADAATLAAELVSWTVGVALGRFDIRLATGERELPGEPEPFDPLPVCSPGMLTGSHGLPLQGPPDGYPFSFPADGVLVDDPGHTRDLTSAVRAVFNTVFGNGGDAAWQEAGELLDPRGHDVGAWLRSGFFEHHLERSSRSRRMAPIVWQLGAGRSGIWAYAHRLTRDSLLAIASEIAAPRLAVEEHRLASLRTHAGASPSARDRAEIDAAEAAIEEAGAVLDEVRRVAPLWSPDFDDGIALVSAPLWRLVSNKAWQKELKGRWDDLVAGKYDWAHVAMHLWPERVMPKCASDRSLALAHGLEDVFWAEGADGKWAKRSRPTRSVEDLVAERTSPAVKAALADLLGAPALARAWPGRGRS